MAWYDERRSQQRNLCSVAFTFAQIAEQTVFAQITERTTPEQLAAANQSLELLCRELEGKVDWDHYASSFGPPHSCVRDVYDDAAARLRNLAIMQEQKPEPPKQQVVTVEGVVIDVEERFRTSAVETDLGTENTPPDNRNGR
jgi:Tfp pilus assembly protein PilN